MIKLKTLEMTCDFCPSQWEGETEDGKRIYIRYRWGHLSYLIGDDPVNSSILIRAGHDYDGIMETETMLKFLNIEVRKGGIQEVKISSQ